MNGAAPAPVREEYAVLTVERLREVLRCDPAAGEFTWIASGSGRQVGAVAGTIQKGHREINISGKTYPLSRLVWLWVHGELPPNGQRIKFKDGNCLNCSIDNLRLARTSSEHNRLFREKYPDANRRHMLGRYQGMSVEVFDALLAEQGGVCAVCKRPETATRNGSVRALCVDHCHTTDEVRGLLCLGCNTAVGYAQDDPAILRAAAAYLERHAMKKAAA